MFKQTYTMNSTTFQPKQAYQLRYTWTAWPKENFSVESLPTHPLPQDLIGAWESDGLRPLEWHIDTNQLQILFSARPDITPKFLAARAKGRLQHVFRQQNLPCAFQRNFSLQSVGAPNASDINTYLQNQLQHGEFADPRYRDLLSGLAFTNPSVSLKAPIPSKSGRYILGYHFVFVVADRWRMPEKTASLIQKALVATSRKSAWKIAKLSLMPDHVHIAIRGEIDTSPLDISGQIREETSRAVGIFGFWMPTGYIGTFGHYGMGAIRKHSRR